MYDHIINAFHAQPIAIAIILVTGAVATAVFVIASAKMILGWIRDPF